MINGRSTREYKDGDWDVYRNHSIGFVFQSYNLIPHQSVLANVELALTLSGVSKKERRQRAIDALTRVGLADQINKRPSQMSGGQMQRVAIARALVNDPDILLADEPTGALDSETSVQVMEILKEISKDRLIIMVTHNPELADRYASRIVRLLDGQIIDDTAPYDLPATDPAQEPAAAPKKANKTRIAKSGKKSMRFTTALSLSLNNLMTKKGRTLLTSFAGSIGIIGIALILSVSTGVQAYIDRVQEDTLSSYPITLRAEELDLSSLITTLMDTGHNSLNADHALDAVYENQIIADLANSFNSVDAQKNDLIAFKKYLEENDDTFRQYATAISYTYDFQKNIFTEDQDGQVIRSDINVLMNELYGGSGMEAVSQNSTMSSLSSMNQNMEIWEELLPGENDQLVNDILREQYDQVWGHWPTAYNEVVLFVNENNEISDLALYTLGLRNGDEIVKAYRSAQAGNQIDTSEQRKWSYDQIGDKTFKLILSADLYQEQSDGTYKDLSQTQTGLSYLYQNDEIAIPLKVVGIFRPNEDAVANMIQGSIGYTSALTDEIIARTNQNALLREQLDHPDTDVLTGMQFDTGEYDSLTEAEKAEKFKAYFSALPEEEQAALYRTILCTPSEEYLTDAVAQYRANTPAEALERMLVSGIAAQMDVDEETAKMTLSQMSEELKESALSAILSQVITEQYAQQVTAQLEGVDAQTLLAQMQAAQYTEAQYAAFFDTYIPSTFSESTFEDNKKLLGYVDPASPATISFYVATFEDKDSIADLIEAYNQKNESDDSKQISYTDYMALLMSSISTIINAISYVLMAFVAISLIVSSIMIGIITYISVLERTKEIGILRAIGASKKDVSRVFNAETLIVGFVSGAFGIGITLLLLIPINAVLHHFTNISILRAQLPVAGAIILVVISMLLTLIAGLIPSSIAAKKDPVEALRSE